MGAAAGEGIGLGIRLGGRPRAGHVGGVVVGRGLWDRRPATGPATGLHRRLGFVLDTGPRIAALVDDAAAHAEDAIRVKRLRVVAGTDGPQTAEIDLVVDGETKSGAASGNGPVDAVFNAITAIIPHSATLDLYQVHAVTGGTDAQAEVSVRLAEGGSIAVARAADADTLVASAKAYVAALNRLRIKRDRAREKVA